MARYDTDDQAIIHASPAEVWGALLREFGGETQWWFPELEFRPLEQPATPAVGTEIEVIPHVRGERRLPFSLAFVARVVELVENERLAAGYVRGAFVGGGEWLLEPVGEGTRLRMRWQVRSHGLLPALVGPMTIAFCRLPAGVDARPLLQGRPGDAFHCPHWGYMSAGRLRIHSAEDIEAGQCFHVGPGHAPETLAPTEMFEVSPTRESREVWQHLQRWTTIANAAAG